MLVTVTNSTSPGRAINKLAPDSLGWPSGFPTATGGARTDALPFPFAHIGELAAAAAKTLPMHPKDLAYKTNPNEPFAAQDDFQTMIKRGVITAGIADQTAMSPYGAFDERFMIEVG